MTLKIFSIAGILIFAACTAKKETISESKPSSFQEKAIEESNSNFFPVTSYLRGEILDIKNSGLTLQKTVTIGNKTDTSWVKIPELEKAFAVFLSPVIDTANLKNIFTESKFLDQTLNAFTFSYDPISAHADTFAFKRWEVYVEPETGKVSRIYLVKRQGPDADMQLTWQSGKWCKIVSLKNVSGKTVIAKEEKISRSYE